MRDHITRSLVLLLVASLFSWPFAITAVSAQALSANKDTAATNPKPIVDKWAGPFGGVPAFDRVEVAAFKPALEEGMAEQLAEIESIAKDPAAPTFENTIAALERAGRKLNRVTAVYAVWASTMASPDFQGVQREMAPKLAAFNDKITQNEALFKRIEAVYNSPEKKRLTSEEQRLTWL